jgi:hypothetical protein
LEEDTLLLFAFGGEVQVYHRQSMAITMNADDVTTDFSEK